MRDYLCQYTYQVKVLDVNADSLCPLPNPTVNIPTDNSLQDNLLALLSNASSSDVTFIVNGEEIGAHEAILSGTVLTNTEHALSKSAQKA